MLALASLWCNVKDIFIWSICIICVNPQHDLWGSTIWESLPGAQTISGPSLVHSSNSVLSLEETDPEPSSPPKHIIRYQTPGTGRGKTFNCPDTPRQASRDGEITVNYLIAWSWFQNIQTMNIFRIWSPWCWFSHV